MRSNRGSVMPKRAHVALDQLRAGEQAQPQAQRAMVVDRRPRLPVHDDGIHQA
jgi:hypothetical protein